MLKVGLLCGVIAAISAAGVSSVLPTAHESKDCDSRFIVELNEDIEGLSSKEAIEQQNKVFKKIQGRVNSNASVVQHYSVLNNAFAVSANNDDLEAISSLPGVKNVYKDEEHVVERSLNSKGITLDVSRASGGEIDVNENASAQTIQKPNDTNDGEGTLIAILDNEFYFKGIKNGNPGFHHEVFDELPDDVQTKVIFEDIDTFVEKGLHATREKGLIGGYEGSLYFNNKVPFYYDYAGDSENGSSSGLSMDYDVSSNIGLHGSHVASIAAANATLEGGEDPTVYTNYKGIAPKAQLACMKVFSDVKQTAAGSAADMGNYSTFSEIGFLAALEDAIVIGADVINVSIGSDLDDFDLTSITMRTLEKLTDAGVLSAISAGNGGKSSYAFAGGYGNWTRDMVETGILGSFANNEKTMSIASGQPDWIFYENAFKIGEENVAFEDQIVNRDGEAAEYTTEYRMKDLLPGADGKYDWVYVPGFGAESDYNGLNVEGKIAVVNRGSIDFAKKYQVALDNSAKALIIINNDPTAMDFTFRCSFGEGFNPKMPVSLVLFKDKPIFQEGQSGKFTIINKEVATNKATRTMSDFSSDGARFDLDLKPEITSPGTNIRGAVWPQNEDERTKTPLSAYEYFNGTSMAAPNYAGAVGVLVSKKAKDAVSDGIITPAEEAELLAYRKTVNMRFMSTAIPMKDFEANGEDGVKTLSSPRMQGAGMINLDGAYHTDVYLKGSDGDKVLNMSKVLLRNNSDIAKGDVKINFTAVNEGNETREYDVKLTVMRPATTLSNKVVSKDYNLIGEVGELNLISGLTYAVLRSGQYVMETNPSTAKLKDVINISRDLEYYTSPEDARNQTNAKKFEMGYYYFSENNTWEKLPNELYQSTKDRVITEVTGQTVSIPKGESKVTINPYSLSQAAKDEIARLYPYGTYIEGFVTLTAKQSGVPNLSIPYLGFYSLTDRDASKSFESAPVVEPFSFEKDKKTIYASDLVNDVTKQLLGKNDVNFESMWLSGYAESVNDISIDEIVTNNSNFAKLPGFASVGTIPDVYSSTQFTEHPGEDIYVGNPQTTNTMIIQQFVMRSVKDNYFEIKDSNGNVVYKSVLEDMLFGEQAYKYPLYKSHVDSDYLGAGYVAHRAYAVIPLYDPISKQPFASGEYKITFHYNLASTNSWVDKSYNLHLDAEAPVVDSVCSFKSGDADKVRITFKDTRVAYAVVGSTKQEVQFDEKTGEFFVELDKSVVDSAIREAGKTSLSAKRLYVAAVDYARGKVGAIIHFDSNEDYSHFTIVQGYGLEINYDFKIEADGTVKLFTINEYHDEIPVELTKGGVIVKGSATYEESGGVNTGLIIGLSAGGGALLLAGVAVMLIIFKKKKMFIFGGKK